MPPFSSSSNSTLLCVPPSLTKCWTNLIYLFGLHAKIRTLGQPLLN